MIYTHLYDTFVYDHQLFSSVDYVRSKRHTNHSISFKHPVFAYGVILGLLSFRPSCVCTLDLSQYCEYDLYSVVIVKPMKASGQMLYRDADFNVSSSFLIEVNETQHIIALHPSEMERKCISLSLQNKIYFCPLPYRICDD